MYHYGMTMAQACGEAPMDDTAFIPGVDFDPADPEEVEHVRMASEQDRHDRIRQLEDENARLRSLLAAQDEGDEV